MSDETKQTDEVKVEDKATETPEETKVEDKKTEAPEVKKEEAVEVEVPAKFKALVEQIENLSVLELNELVKVFEQKFGVSAQATAVAGVAEGGSAVEEKDSFIVELTSVGDQKIQVIKAVKEILGLGLKEAKDLVDGAPNVLKEDVKKEEAESWKAKIEEAGGKVELK